jgi:hypothetical protein
MATIERKPLPPPNSGVTKITEADRAEIIARANDVIDHYLNGPGSYFDSGTQSRWWASLETTAQFRI